MAGQLNHILRWRPDDKIYYTIKYEGGMPKDPNIQISRGGVAAWFKVIANAIILIGADKVQVGEKETRVFKPEKLAEIATDIAEIVEGRGWEPQAAAVINLIGLYAMQGTMICSMTIL